MREFGHVVEQRPVTEGVRPGMMAQIDWRVQAETVGG